MIKFRKTIKTSIVIIFSFITFWINLTICESYCDNNVGICLYAYKYMFMLDHARYECNKNGSLLLEIYDENYKEVTIKALQKYGLENEGLLFGLVYKDGQFQWLSKREMSKVPVEGLDAFYSKRNCNFLLKLFHSQLHVEPMCANFPIAYFVCMKEFNRSTTLLTTTNIVIPNMSTTDFIKNNQSTDNNYDQLNELRKSNVGIGVGVTISLILIIVVVVLWICFLRKRKTNETDPINDDDQDSFDYKSLKAHE